MNIKKMIYLTCDQTLGFYYEPSLQWSDGCICIEMDEPIQCKDRIWIVYHKDTGSIFKVCKYKKNNVNLKIPTDHIGYTVTMN